MKECKVDPLARAVPNRHEAADPSSSFPSTNGYRFSRPSGTWTSYCIPPASELAGYFQPSLRDELPIC